MRTMKMTPAQRQPRNNTLKGIALALAAGVVGALIWLAIGGGEPDIGGFVGALATVGVVVPAVAKVLFFPTLKSQDNSDDHGPFVA
jgi:hypothetical protein